jgi:hypothetical protein
LGGRNRSVWAVIFRHPFRSDERGKIGRRVRRSLGTTDKSAAQALVDQANVLLSDNKWWSPAMREQAAREFAPEVVAAFYDDLAPTPRDGWQLRNDAIPLPTPTEGYSRVLFLGTTGAGKTTLLRQLIGTGRKGEKFPSTSPAKTTTCDIEIIMSDAARFEMVVSFLPKDLVRQYVEECVTAAATSLLKRERRERTVRSLLEHSDQRFRLSYILGTLGAEIDDEEVEDAGDEYDNTDVATSEDRERFAAAIERYLARIEGVSRAASSRLERALSFSLDAANQEDRDTFEELLEGYLRDEDDFHEIVDDIMDDSEARFAPLADGDLRLGASGWPECWVYRADNDCRAEFLRRASWFVGNQAPQFGTLLTPLVEGIRIRGPFVPSWSGDVPKLVLMDGEGLGHTVDAASSLSTRVTKRYQVSDAILLVDKPTPPMQAAPTSALRSIVSSGQQAKLVVAFTHFDQMRGANLPNRSAKEQDILASVDQSIGALGKEMGRSVENSLRKLTQERVFFLSNLNDQIPIPPEKVSQRHTADSLARLVQTLSALATQPTPDAAVPIYDDANLVLAVHAAIVQFRDPWRARLPVEHWTRVKALTRRLGHLGRDEYDTLRPVADLIDALQTHVRPFLGSPLRWEPANGATDEMMAFAIDRIAQKLSQRLHDWVGTRLVRDRIIKWQRAYGHRGVGSARERRRDIESIYSEAAPVPGQIADPPSNEFLREIRLLIRNAVDAGGGKLEGLSNTATVPMSAQS